MQKIDIKTLSGKYEGAKANIRWDTLSRIHLQTARQLAAEKVNFRLSSPEIVGIENSLNETWHSCLKGQATLDDFRAINEKWAETVRAVNEKAKRAALF